MKTSPIATSTISSGLKAEILANQNRLNAARLEMTTGRHADMGLTLGTGTGATLALHTRIEGLETTITQNKFLATRLDTGQKALESLGKGAQSLVSTLLASRSAAGGQAIAKDAAVNGLASLSNLLNTTFDGDSIFGGINTGTPPLKPFSTTPPSSAAAAITASFTATFGMAPNAPGVSAITPAAMNAYLDTTFAAHFADPQWQANWSNASDQLAQSRIEPGRLTETSVSANADGFRTLAKSLAMVASFSNGNLGTATFQALIDKAAGLAGSAGGSINALAAHVGGAQELVATATTRMEALRTGAKKDLGAREGVDQYEATARVNELMTTLEASYKLTSRISALSLVNFL